MSARRAIVQVDGSLAELPAGDSLIDDAARRRAELYAIRQRETESIQLAGRAQERVATATLNRSTGMR